MTNDLYLPSRPNIPNGDSSLFSSESHKYRHPHSQDRPHNLTKSPSWHPLLGAPIPCCEGVGLGHWSDDSLNFRGHCRRYTCGKKET